MGPSTLPPPPSCSRLLYSGHYKYGGGGEEGAEVAKTWAWLLMLTFPVILLFPFYIEPLVLSLFRKIFTNKKTVFLFLMSYGINSWFNCRRSCTAWPRRFYTEEEGSPLVPQANKICNLTSDASRKAHRKQIIAISRHKILMATYNFFSCCGTLIYRKNMLMSISIFTLATWPWKQSHQAVYT